MQKFSVVSTIEITYTKYPQDQEQLSLQFVRKDEVIDAVT